MSYHGVISINDKIIYEEESPIYINGKKETGKDDCKTYAKLGNQTKKIYLKEDLISKIISNTYIKTSSFIFYNNIISSILNIQEVLSSFLDIYKNSFDKDGKFLLVPIFQPEETKGQEVLINFYRSDNFPKYYTTSINEKDCPKYIKDEDEYREIKTKRVTFIKVKDIHLSIYNIEYNQNFGIDIFSVLKGMESVKIDYENFLFRVMNIKKREDIFELIEDLRDRYNILIKEQENLYQLGKILRNTLREIPNIKAKVYAQYNFNENKLYIFSKQETILELPLHKPQFSIYFVEGIIDNIIDLRITNINDLKTMIDYFPSLKYRNEEIEKILIETYKDLKNKNAYNFDLRIFANIKYKKTNN